MGHYSTLIGGGKGEGSLYRPNAHKIVASVVNVLTRIVAIELACPYYLFDRNLLYICCRIFRTTCQQMDSNL